MMDAMNEINASRRQREAAFERGEAEKMLKIKASEASWHSLDVITKYGLLPLRLWPFDTGRNTSRGPGFLGSPKLEDSLLYSRKHPPMAWQSLTKPASIEHRKLGPGFPIPFLGPLFDRW